MEPTTGADEGVMQLVSTEPLPYIGQNAEEHCLQSKRAVDQQKRGLVTVST
jgi:hypothetical protein